MKTIYSPIKKPIYSYPFQQPVTEIAFFDIETTGLSPNASSLYLIGLMRFDAKKDQWMLCQWFADNYQSEKDLILSFLGELSDIEYLYHFNGKTFDIPYLLKKCTRHAISLSSHCSKLLNDATGIHSIDLLAKIRSLRHALLLDKCNQTAIERWLGIKRTDPFSGAELITVYSEFMQQKILNADNAQKLEQVLLLHNHDDVEMMLNICSLLTYDEYLSDAATNRLLCKETLSTLTAAPLDSQSINALAPDTQELQNINAITPDMLKLQNINTITPDTFEPETLTITLTLPFAVPKKVTMTACYPASTATKKSEADMGACFKETITDNTSAEADCSFWPKVPTAYLTFQENTATLQIPVYHGTLKFFFPNYKDYYYLPKEDTAMHKSVAEFVDSAFRKKATAATCYTKKEGVFLPNLFPAKKTKQPDSVSDSALFYLQYKDKLSFCELPKDFATNQDFWMKYLKKQMLYFR